MPKLGPVGITDVILRDAHQSLLATRMRTDDMLPACDMLDEVGFYSLEVWGGATFDTCLRFLNEDPWERLRRLRKALPNTKLQMLLRGQNVVGYRNFADDVVEAFCRKAVENGMDIFRIFDALNDVRNMEMAMRVVKDAGGHVQGTICFTTSPVHTIETFVEMAKQLADKGADSLCVKDMAGIMPPLATYEIIARIKAEVEIPVTLHSHHTSGMGSMTCLKAVEAGADAIDTAISSLSLGTGHAPTESMVTTLKGSPRDPGLNLGLLTDISDYFADVRKKYAAFDNQSIGVDTNVLTYQVPGGMISNLISQLKEFDALDRLPEVFDEVPRVRKDLGYPPLVTPSSQFVGTQAVFNVVLGERYKTIIKEIQQYFRGYYGTPPAPVNPEVRALVCEENEVISERPGDALPPELDKAREELGDLAPSEEDVISYALFPGPARDFFERRARGDIVDAETAAAITAFLVRQNQAESRDGHVHAGPTVSPWKTAGRQAAVRRGVF